MKSTRFERVEPNQIKVGDIIMCRYHDDQLEWKAARVIAIEMDDVPGIYTWEEGDKASYDYQVWLICRHVSLKHLDAKGGPVYRWHHFHWNRVTRYLMDLEREGL